jgi:hypothetical protein
MTLKLAPMTATETDAAFALMSADAMLDLEAIPAIVLVRFRLNFMSLLILLSAQCSGNCVTCARDGVCSQCQPGFQGPQCTRSFLALV